MPFLSEISLTWFRNFEQKRLAFNSPVVGIAGKNGMGKTNLLDAVYYLCFTKSYFQSKERHNVLNGREGFRIEGHWQEADKREKTTCIYREGKKTVLQNDLAYERVSEHIGKYHAVMIAPDDLGLINNGSDGRRKFIDGLLAQTNTEYLEHLLAYQKILLQKNAYLKQTPPANVQWSLLDIYDEQLAVHGWVLLEQRMALSAFLPERVCAGYRQLSATDSERPDMEYQPCAQPEGLLEMFRQNRRYDLDYKRTVKGLHTDDWLFMLNGEPLKARASQGQKKSFLISLKLAQIDWLCRFDAQPMLLMDDIFEKLDRYRIERLFGLLPQFNLPQLIITHTEAAEMEKALGLYHDQNQIICL
ncbi:MAG TPA: DNA replication and repair protein RecF [Edaphocola sp.]|nr:DNA replication and repair protein RecF [Edaphocola sp.]